MNYAIFDPKVERPLHELPRPEARAAYDWFMKSIPVRVEELKSLVARDGVHLNGTPSCLIALDEWLFAQLQESYLQGMTEPSPFFYSLSNDIGMYLGESLIADSSNLRWEFYLKGKKALSYQRPVIMGFKVKNQNYNVDFDDAICRYLHRVLRTGEWEGHFLSNMYEQAKKHS